MQSWIENGTVLVVWEHVCAIRVLLNERETRKERRIELRGKGSLVDSQRGILCFLTSFNLDRY